MLAVALTILGITVILAVLFFVMYHTYHGDLPAMMKVVVSIGLIVGAVLLGIALL